MDRISYIPISIIHQIMSYLTPREIARTNTLSKTWKSFRTSFPIMEFDHINMRLGRQPSQFYWLTDEEMEHYRGSSDMFFQWVDDTLHFFYQTKFTMQAFHLVLVPSVAELKSSWSNLVNKWIELALDRHVKRISLQIFQSQQASWNLDIINYDNLYTLPENLFLADSVTILELSGCALKKYPLSTYNFTLLHLVELYLFHVEINDEVIHKLTTNSPQLQIFALISCWGFHHLNISQHPNLRQFVVVSEKRKLNRAPNLEDYRLNTIGLYIRNGNIGKDVRIFNLTGNLDGINNLISKFPLLEILKVCKNAKLTNLTVISNLKRLIVEDCERLEALHIDAPQLCYFHFSFPYKPPTAVSIKAHNLLKSYLLFQQATTNFDWYVRFINFINQFPKIQYLRIHTLPESKSADLFNFRRRRVEIKEISLSMYEDADLIIGDLLCVCFPKTLWVEFCQQATNSIRVKVLYEKLKNAQNYCVCSDGMCWRHYLKNVKINYHDQDYREISFDLEWNYNY